MQINFQNLEYGQLGDHLQSDQNYKKNFQENMSKSLNPSMGQPKAAPKEKQYTKQNSEFKLRIRPDIIFGRLIEGPELQTYEQNVAQQIQQMQI